MKRGKQPFFSILLPTRNRAALLSQTLGSVLSQDFSDFEIIASDNNSKDDTWALLSRLSEKDARIKAFRQGRDLYIGDNWNFCYSKARGQFFLLLGDDDCLTPGILRLVHETIKSQPDADIVGFRYALFQHGKNLLMWHKYDGKTVKGLKELFVRRAFEFITPLEHTIVVRRSLSKQAFPAGNPYRGAYLDQLAWFGFFQEAKGIYYIEKTGIFLGIAESSSTSLQKNYKTRHEAFKGSFSSGVSLPLPGDYFANMQYETLSVAKRSYPALCGKEEIRLGKYWAKIGAEICMFAAVAALHLDFCGLAPILSDFKAFAVRAPKKSVLAAIFIMFPWSLLSGAVPFYFREATKDIFLKISGMRKGYAFRFSRLKNSGGNGWYAEACEKLK